MADLVVVGSYNAAMTVYSTNLPAPGETVVGDRFERGPGGKGANQAIGARRLGADVLFVTRLGADAFGEGRLQRGPGRRPGSGGIHGVGDRSRLPGRSILRDP